MRWFRVDLREVAEVGCRQFGGVSGAGGHHEQHDESGREVSVRCYLIKKHRLMRSGAQEDESVVSHVAAQAQLGCLWDATKYRFY